MWTLLLLLVSSVSLTTSKSLTYEKGDENNVLAQEDTDAGASLLGSLAKVNLDGLPDDYENSSSHVERINDHDVKVNMNISHHKTNKSESTKFSQSKVIDEDGSKGFQKEIYQEFSFGGDGTDGTDSEDDERMRQEAQEKLQMVEKLENLFREANEEMQEFFDNIV